MKKWVLRFSTVAIIFVFTFSGLNSVQAGFKMPASSLPAESSRTFEDLSRCLQSQGKDKVLDVFYLIDESGSLKATDPNNDRADILSSSLEQLASFNNDVTVNYSVAFFAHQYTLWQSWRTVNKGGIVPEAARLNSEVRKRNNGLLTDWLQGIDGAINELNAQHARTNGCSTLIWLTDGGIQLADDVKTEAAIDRLCTNRFDVLRKNGVTVLGILLKNEKALADLSAEDQEYQADRMSRMGPMVTGRGVHADGEEKTCGTYPVPKNYSQGALFVAQDPTELAYEFLKLPPRIEGCANLKEFGRGKGEFEVENGISAFQIVTTARDWRLIDPAGKTVTAATKGIGIFETAGAAQIKVGATNSGIGKWNFTGNGGDSSLFYCSGLDIRIDPGSEFIAGKAGILSGKVISQATGLAADLTAYDSDHPITIELITNGKSGEKREAEQSEPASFMLKKFTPGTGSSEAEVRITLNLKTKRGIQLAPVSISQKIDVRLLSNYPSIKNDPIVLSMLASALKPAKGSVTFTPPASADGKICVDPGAKPIVIQDKVSRADTYEISTTGLDVDGCLPIRQGEESEFKLTVSNSVTADGDVVLGLPITYFSDAEPGKQFTLNAEVNFKSDKPGDAFPLNVILMVLGTLIPLGAIYFLNWLITKLTVGSQLKRATYSVKVTPGGKYTALDGSTIIPQDVEFKGLPQQGDVRSFTEQGLTFRAKVSKLALPGPWFEAVAPSEHRVITLAHATPRIKGRFASGKLAPTSDDLAKVWVLQIADSELVKFDKNTPVIGKLIIFKRNNSKEVDQYRKVFDSVTNKPGVWGEVTRLAAVVAAEKAVKPGGTPPKKKEADPNEGNGGGTQPRPPRPGGGIGPRPTGSSVSPKVSRPGQTPTPTIPTAPSTPTNPSAPPTPGGKPPRK
jgi:hypothetical protein